MKTYTHNMIPLVKKKLSPLLLLLTVLNPGWTEPVSKWIHTSGSELYLSSYYDIADISMIVGDGRFTYFDSSQELFLNYNSRMDYHNYLGWISFNGTGGQYQYNKIPHMVVGMKGSLDDNRFIEVYDNWFSRSFTEAPYPRKSGKYISEINYGIKNYADLFFKPVRNLTWGFWNHTVLGEDTTDDPVTLTGETGRQIRQILDAQSFEKASFYMQTTPRLIYELKGRINRLVAEVYMDNRIYFGDSISVENRTYRSYYKFVAAPQWIVNREGKHFHLYIYSSLEAEKFQYLDYIQWKLRSSPALTWKYDRLRFGLSGAGYEFQDEIGIDFDNNELIAYKRALTYSAWVFAVKGALFYEVTPFLTIGTEPGYRGGLWEDREDEGLLEEYFVITSLGTSHNLGRNWDLNIRASLEFYYFNDVIPEEKKLPSENVFRLSLLFTR